MPTRCPEQYMSIFVFRSKIFSSKYRFLEVAQIKRRCKRYQRGTLKSLLAFSFFGPKIFSLISRILKVDKVKVVSAVPTRYPEQYLNIA